MEIKTNKIKQGTFKPIETRIQNLHAQFPSFKNRTGLNIPSKFEVVVYRGHVRGGSCIPRACLRGKLYTEGMLEGVFVYRGQVR